MCDNFETQRIEDSYLKYEMVAKKHINDLNDLNDPSDPFKLAEKYGEEFISLLNPFFNSIDNE